MSPVQRLKPTEWLLEWSRGELRAAQKALGYFARHDGRCPVGQGRGEPCGCGLDGAQTRLRDAVRTAENLMAELKKPAAPTPKGK